MSEDTSFRHPRQPEGGDDFGAVFSEHAPYVARVALRILGRDSDVDDVVQDVFAVAFDKRHELRRAESVRGWLGRITTNRALALLRWRKVRRALGLYDGSLYDEVASPDASPEQRLMVSRLYRALDALPARQRVAWVLRKLEGERLEDVARLCRCSLAAVKRRIVAAQARLERALDL